MTLPPRSSGPPLGTAAPELVESGFALENADAPYLHAGLNLADIAHLLDLHRRRLLPQQAARDLMRLLLEVYDTAPDEFPYRAELGEPYNSRESYFVERLGTTAGWLHAGRPRRESARLALRLHLRRQLLDLVGAISAFGRDATELAGQHVTTLMPDQTYLQQAQPSTFGHYTLSFVYPAVRDARRLLGELDWVNSSPGGAGCVNGTRLLDDRAPIAEALGFDGVIEHTRDAMWQIDGLIHILATVASLLSTQSKLAEDLEIWSSSEFDFVDLDDGFTRASVLMPQKRNPYSLAIVRGASGVLIGRLTGFLAVAKSPSARSDNLIFAYGEVPRALDLALRVTTLMSGVVRTLKVNERRMAAELAAGYTQATDLCELITVECGVDYRSAYDVVGKTVREASRRGIPGSAITGELLDSVARAETGRSWGLADKDLTGVVDPRAIVESRVGVGGAAPRSVTAMVEHCLRMASDLDHDVRRRVDGLERAERLLLQRARRLAEGEPGVMTAEGTPVRLPDEVSVVNVGLQRFAEAVREQVVPVQHVDWRIPAGGDPEALDALERLYGERAEVVDRANAEVLRRLDHGNPQLETVGPAAELVPGLAGRVLLHCGPAVTWPKVCDPLRRSLRAATVAEGWADDVEQADRLLSAGAVRLEPAYRYDVVLPMAGSMGPSAPVFVVGNRAGGTRAMAPVNQGPGDTAWFGRETPAAVERLRFLREVAGPLLQEVLRQSGPVDLFSLAAQGVQMGDDVHLRTQGTTNLLLRDLLPHLAALPDDGRVELARFLSGNHLFFLNLAMAAAKSVAVWAADVDGSSIVTLMCRNGTSYGIRLAGSDRLFLAEAPPVRDAMYLADHGPEDGAPDIGDSAILELVGLGAAAAAGSPAVAGFLGGRMADAAAVTEQMRLVCAGESTRFKLPTRDNAGTPLGVDVRRVLELGVTPRVTTGILHRSSGAGQVGAGVATAPVECFRAALLHLAGGER